MYIVYIEGNTNKKINNIIEKSTTAQGKTVKNIVRYSDTKAKILGKNKGKGGFLFRFSADDLQGFTYEIIKGIRKGNVEKMFSKSEYKELFTPEQLAEIREIIEHDKVSCIFSEPQFNPDIIKAVAKDTNVATGVIDPLGATLEPGKDLYFDLIKNMSKSFKGC